MTDQTGRDDRISTGVEPLDDILAGGLIPGRSYLVRGPPGSGKTVLGVQFLVAGAEVGGTPLMLSMEETEDDIRRNAKALDLDMSEVEIVDLSPGSEDFGGEAYDVFGPDEVEQPEITERMREAIEATDADRVFLDPVTQLRYLSPDTYRFRKQLLGLKRYVTEREATFMFTSQAAASAPDDDLQFVSDGVLDLRTTENVRVLDVPKFRGSDTLSGRHTMRIERGGIEVFPHLSPGDRNHRIEAEQISSGVPEIDKMLDGGLERGTTTIISGPTGVGKTTTGTLFTKEAAGRGEASAIYLFEESQATLVQRSKMVNIPVQEMIDRGTLHVRQVEALERTPEELAQMVRHDVEEEGVRIVMIDGISGYEVAVEGSTKQLSRKLHSLCRWLTNQGVSVILIDEVGTVGGHFEATQAGTSYLADNIVFLRQIEIDGELRKVIGVLKKRVSDFERQLREIEITEHGVRVGERLRGLQGILSGAPTFASQAGDDGA